MLSISCIVGRSFFAANVRKLEAPRGSRAGVHCYRPYSIRVAEVAKNSGDHRLVTTVDKISARLISPGFGEKALEMSFIRRASPGRAMWKGYDVTWTRHRCALLPRLPLGLRPAINTRH